MHLEHILRWLCGVPVVCQLRQTRRQPATRDVRISSAKSNQNIHKHAQPHSAEIAIKFCKTFIRRFDSDRRLNRIKHLRAATWLPVAVCITVVSLLRASLWSCSRYDLRWLLLARVPQQLYGAASL